MTVKDLIWFLEGLDPDQVIVWDASGIDDLEDFPALILNSIQIVKIDKDSKPPLPPFEDEFGHGYD